MSIEVTSEETSGDVWESYSNYKMDEKDHSVAELNGLKREFTVLRKKIEWAHLFEGKHSNGNSLDGKSFIRKSSDSTLIRPMKTETRVEGEIAYEWGKNEGPTWSGKVSAQANDDKGNYAKVEIKRDSDGSKCAKASAGHKEKDKD